MIVLEFKLKGKAQQYRVIDEMVRTAQFVRNKTLKYWLHNQGVKLVGLYKQCAIMAKEFEWADLIRWRVKLRHERTIFAIQRFFANCFRQESREKMIPAV
jgi:putative transposase